MRPAPLAVTLGDPRGIGPEVAMRAAVLLAEDEAEVSLLWVGSEDVLAQLPSGARMVTLPRWTGTEADAGRVSVDAIRAAVDLALKGEVGGVVTAPVHKPALHAAGWEVPGQTELLRDLTGADPVGMLMCAEQTRLGGALRVLLATTHVPLRDVPTLLTSERLVAQTRLLQGALTRHFLLESPRIALCAFNPHASDGGLFGDEEARVYAPVLARLRDDGVDVTGPVPADTVFSRTVAGEFDAVVAPYHDVGMAAFKTVSFGTGVNVTVGLPFIRTSPDHGTAFDIAGTGRADASSMLEALRLAGRLARNRFDTSVGSA